MGYETEDEILNLINSFKTATLKHECWRHPEHLIVAIYFCSNNDFENALKKMRKGILKLNKAHGVETTLVRGYHETLTVFWVSSVFDYLTQNPNKSLTQLASEILKKFDKNSPLKFYSRKLLFSKEARFSFVEADIKTFSARTK